MARGPRIAAPEDTDWTPLPSGPGPYVGPVDTRPVFGPDGSIHDAYRDAAAAAGAAAPAPAAAAPAPAADFPAVPPPPLGPDPVPDPPLDTAPERVYQPELPGDYVDPYEPPPAPMTNAEAYPYPMTPPATDTSTPGPAFPGDPGFVISPDDVWNQRTSAGAAMGSMMIVEGERGFDRPMLPPDDDWQRVMRGTYGGRPDDFEELLRGPVPRRAPPKFRVFPPSRTHIPYPIRPPPLPRGSVPVPAIILDEMRDILRDYERRAKQEREAVRPGPGGYSPERDLERELERDVRRPPFPSLPPLPPPQPPPTVPREPPQPVAKRDTGPFPLPQPPPVPIPRLPAPIPRKRGLASRLRLPILPPFFNWRDDPWPTHLSDFAPQPLTSAPPSTMPEPLPLVPSTVPQPLPVPRPFPPNSAASPPSSQPSPALMPLTGFNTDPLRFTSNSDCDCSQTENPPLPSDTIADMKPFKRRMSQYSLNNLRRGKR